MSPITFYDHGQNYIVAMCILQQLSKLKIATQNALITTIDTFDLRTANFSMLSGDINCIEECLHQISSMNSQHLPSSFCNNSNNNKIRKYVDIDNKDNDDDKATSNLCPLITFESEIRDDENDRPLKRSKFQRRLSEVSPTTRETRTPGSLGDGTCIDLPNRRQTKNRSSSIPCTHDTSDHLRRDGLRGGFTAMGSKCNHVVIPDASSCDQLKRHLLLPYEYDEGMNHFLEWGQIEVHETATDAVKTSISMYNIGLNHCSGNNNNRKQCFEHGEKWFRMALTYMEEVAAETLLSFKIMRCLGFCMYRLYRFDDAYVIFHKALQFVSDFSMYEQNESTPEVVECLQSIASVKNAMAMSLFHSSTEKNLTIALELLHDSLHISSGLHLNETPGVCRRLFIATCLNNIGRVYFNVPDFAKAHKAFSASLNMKKQLNSEDISISYNIKVTVYNLAQACHQLRLLDEAKEYYYEFVQLDKEIHTFGSFKTREALFRQRDLTVVYSKLGHVSSLKDEISTARELYEKALKAARLALNAKVLRNRSELASILNILGTICYKMKDLPAALRYIQEGFEVETLLIGNTSHPNAIISLMNIAQIYRDMDQFAPAFNAYEQVYRVQIKQGQKTSTASTLFSMGLMMHRMKVYGEAISYYRQALALQTQIHGTEGSIDVAATLNSIGIVLFHLGEKESAKGYFEESLAMRRKFLGPYHADIPVTLFNLAMVYLEANNEEMASEILKETLRVERTALGPKCHESIQTLQHLGFSLQVLGELNEALECFEEALEIEQKRYGNNHIRVGKLLNFIGNLHLQRGNIASMMKCYTMASRINLAYKEPLAIAGYNLYCLSKLLPECAGVA
jgi:tetratricopeptide (TPR) repeat protein